MNSPGSTDGWWSELLSSIDAKDADRFVAFLSEDAEFRFGSSPSVSGVAAIKRAVAEFFDTIEASRHVLLRTWQGNGTRVCQGEVTYTRSDRTRVTLPFVNVFEMDGEKIGQYLIYVDIGPLLGGARAVTPPAPR